MVERAAGLFALRKLAGMLRIIDRVADTLGHAAAWMFFLTGVMVTYEVVARYVFNAPTIWAAELSQMLLLWGTFIAMATLLRQRAHIRITLLTARLGPRARQLSELLSLSIIGGFAAVAAYHGWWIAFDSLERGRSTGTMLNLPNWWSEVVIPVGFAILLLQCLAEMARVLGGKLPPEDGPGEAGG